MFPGCCVLLNRKAWAHVFGMVVALLSGVGGIGVGMYLRSTQRRRKDGSLVRYLQLAHNRREGGVTRAEVLLNLGREDELDVEGLRRLARSIRRYTDRRGLEDAGLIEPADGLEVVVVASARGRLAA